MIEYKFYLTENESWCIIKLRKKDYYLENMKTIATIKRNIEDHVGDKVTKANGGRRRS